MAAGKKRVAQALHGPLLGKYASLPCDASSGFCIGVETGETSARLTWCKHVAPGLPPGAHRHDGAYATPGRVGWSFRQLLLHSYSTVEAMEEVLALGFLQRLGVEHAGGPGHSLKRPLPGVTVAYHRDGGQPLKAAFSVAEWPDCQSAVCRHTGLTVDRVYVLTPGGWMVSDHSSPDVITMWLETPLERLGRLT